MKSPTGIDLAALREKLKTTTGRTQWRSLEEAADAPEFRALLDREFPFSGAESADDLGRRDFLKLIAASLAVAGLGGCTRQPVHNIVPYIDQPENLVPGIPLFYSTAMPHNGFALGIRVKSYEGHPVKIEGNPGHSISQGATNVFMQAALLDLYDPDRSQAVLENGEISSWNRFAGDLAQAVAEQRSKNGAGLRILTETITSPTLADQLQNLLKRFPEARWHQWQPVNLDEPHEGARMAFGEVVETQYSFDRAEVVASLDSDFMFTHPASLRYARDFSDGRRLWKNPTRMNRLWAAETAPSITGSMADHRLPVRPSTIPNLARELARRFGVEGVAAGQQLSQEQTFWIDRLTTDLQNHRSASIVIAGEWQPASVHALAHAINERLENLGQTVRTTKTVESNAVNQLQSIQQLVEDMKSGRVDTLIVLGGNPAFNAPADLDFSAALKKVRRAIHLGLHRNETSALCRWHVPEAHFLESWGDARAFDGTVTILQPLIAPLYGGVTAYEMVESVTTPPPLASYDIVRRYWKSQNVWKDFETSWKQSIHDGWVSGSQAAERNLRIKNFELGPEREVSGGAIEIAYRPDPSIWDGRYASNGWLQETPRPLTKITWDNAALISPKLAEANQLSNGDMVELQLNGAQARIPVWILPGHAENSVTVHMGNGRRVAGAAAKGTGFDVYGLRMSKGLWSADGLELHRGTGRRHQFALSQIYQKVPAEERQVVRTGTFDDFRNDPGFVQPTLEKPKTDDTLYNPGEHDYGGYRWAMAIDLNACIGCNACILGCNTENNIPIVGKEQVRRGRIMSWIRVDTYFEGTLDNPSVMHTPMPCMHCENAPCELVCPVEATLHDHEGLNVQVYNRCVGTRFCSNNCPYKVRRFNFLQYQDYKTPNFMPMRNPQVTVRWRGVMEKCTYCVQRISVARINSEKENRRITEAEVRPACAQACPTNAIVFGDLSDPKSTVSQLRRNSLTFSMLGELNTRPRTTYLTKLTNP